MHEVKQDMALIIWVRQNHMVQIQRNLKNEYSDQSENNLTVQFMRFKSIRQHRS